MANGDIAAGLGWNVFPATQAHSLGYDDINYALDRVAQERAERVASDNNIWAALGVAKIIVSYGTPDVVNYAIWIRPVT